MVVFDNERQRHASEIVAGSFYKDYNRAVLSWEKNLFGKGLVQNQQFL